MCILKTNINNMNDSVINIANKHLSILNHNAYFDQYSYTEVMCQTYKPYSSSNGLSNIGEEFSFNGTSDDELLNVAKIYMIDNMMSELYFTITDITTNMSQWMMIDSDNIIKISTEIGEIKLMYIIVNDILSVINNIANNVIIVSDNKKINKYFLTNIIKGCVGVIERFDRIINTPVSGTMLRVYFYKELMREAKDYRQCVLNSKMYCENIMDNIGQINTSDDQCLQTYCKNIMNNIGQTDNRNIFEQNSKCLWFALKIIFYTMISGSGCGIIYNQFFI
jgi:hypothetical protein